VTTPTPHTTGTLLAISPDVAEFLTAVTLCETSLAFVRHYTDCNIAKVFVSSNIFWDFDAPGNVIKKGGMLAVIFHPAGDLRVAEICLALVTSSQCSPTHLKCPLQV
jgi:hypothetical protein